MKSLQIILTIFASLFALNAFGQGSLRGRVIDENNLPLPGALVYVDSQGKGTATDVNGEFRLVNIDAGDQELIISYLGYEKLTKTVTVKSGETTVIDFQFEAAKALDEVIVYGQSGSQARALNQQKNAMNIVNVISADQVGRFPDSNIGDALKRVSGIYVQYDQGEARFANIRGTAPQLNSVTINGERIPSAEAENRSVQLDLIPSDMIQTIEVSKAVTPDMDADAIGGAVNLVTRAAPYDTRISATAGSGYNLIAEKPMVNGSFVLGDRYLNDKLGVIVSASVFNHHLGSDNMEAEWTEYESDSGVKKIGLKEQQIRQYYLQRLRQSYSASLDYKLNENHTIYLKGMYNHRNDWENRFRTKLELDDYDFETDSYVVDKIARETKGGANDKFRRLEDQRVYSLALSGDHQFGKLVADWSTSYSKASEERPQERYITYEGSTEDMVKFTGGNETPMPNNFFDFNSGYKYELDEVTEENQYTEEENVTARLNFTLPISEGLYANKLKFGGALKMQSKSRNNEFFEYDVDGLDNVVFDNKSKSNYLVGDYQIGSFVSEEYLGNLDLTQYEKESVNDEIAGNFDAQETVTAGYLMLDQKLGDKLSAIVGLRMEKTAVEYEGLVYDDDQGTLTATERASSDYTNFLPAIHLKYELSSNSNVRVAWTNTLARPNYFDLVPYQLIVQEDEEIEIGNPNLEATTAMNFDLLYDYYFSNVGIVTAGAFYKGISNYIINQVTELESGTYAGYDQSQPINAGDALVYGLEFGVQRRLNFLPAPLNNLNVYLNYTYTQSETDNFNLEDREDEVLPLQGTAENAFNASLMYQSKKFSLGVSFNYSSDFIDEFGGEAAEDRYYDKVTYLDANASYMITDNFRFYVEANNLLNQPLRYYQGTSSYTMQTEFYAPRVSFGLKFDM
ncbi:TonB-dependent receptor [Sediminitomix flava]|uniref:TonB-dependent receptor n=1 Tax=Sediminitomix flava TaxID=379075 RepID=A0A315ZC73_SEDFL|nr:TonB-dependent receptor [Sediminitomix flava]PWJ42920.1 TonB-dependent receptor [Sediminitomix flava]